MCHRQEKLLAKQLGTDVDELFPDSLEKVRSTPPNIQGKKKNDVPVTPCINRKMKPIIESSNMVTQKV